LNKEKQEFKRELKETEDQKLEREAEECEHVIPAVNWVLN
jgi:hypothetical protein